MATVTNLASHQTAKSYGKNSVVRRPSDAATKRKLLGYWKSGRHSYLFKSDGICYMVEGTTTYHWDIRGGVYYIEAKAYEIVSLNGNEFEYRSAIRMPSLMKKINSNVVRKKIQNSSRSVVRTG